MAVIKACLLHVPEMIGPSQRIPYIKRGSVPKNMHIIRRFTPFWGLYDLFLPGNENVGDLTVFLMCCIILIRYMRQLHE